MLFLPKKTRAFFKKSVFSPMTGVNLRAASGHRGAAPGRRPSDPLRLHDTLQRRLAGRQRPPLPLRETVEFLLFEPNIKLN